MKAQRRMGATLLALACIIGGCSTAGPTTRSAPKPASSFVEYSRDAYIRWKTSHAFHRGDYQPACGDVAKDDHLRGAGGGAESGGA
jgi:hypothetical protein